ncbi:hypothetical protein [Stutzerimonas stutzeri]|uniref:hypothetical protein n=1 Tax=Stutzerimonas stutzeri TaxID=316 RepID=UPI00210D1675|nr:hypothetical protein [Stutzerimonas stutzeri]MCQ4322519.1 hypothetical protein [Stutzerimonas stutzeri]
MPGQPVRIFVDGDLEFAPHTEINPGGSAADLLIVVRGKLTIGTDNSVNALLYVTGDAEVNPGTRIEGALTADGSIDTKPEDELIYDDEAAAHFTYDDLCETAGTNTAAIDHFEFVTGAGAHSCSPHAITLKACTNAAPGVNPLLGSAWTKTNISLK